jgi:hypothetical protein
MERRGRNSNKPTSTSAGTFSSANHRPNPACRHFQHLGGLVDCIGNRMLLLPPQLGFRSVHSRDLSGIRDVIPIIRHRIYRQEGRYPLFCCILMIYQRIPCGQKRVSPMPLSVEEIADRICPLSKDWEAVRERVRYWARSGILTPWGGVAPGKGRARLFERAAVIDAALLSALLDLGLTGLGGEALPYVRALVQEAAHAWAQGDRRARWVEILPGAKTAFPHVNKPQVTLTAAGSVLVNLTPLFARLAWSAADEEIAENEAAEAGKQPAAKKRQAKGAPPRRKTRRRRYGG